MPRDEKANPDGTQDSPQKGLRWWRHFRRDAAFRHRVLTGTFLVCALALEVAVLWVDPPEHRQAVGHFIAWAALVLLPLTLLAIVVRTRWGRLLVPQRYTVRPFETLKTRPQYEGSALAVLFQDAMSYWRINAKGERQRKGPVDPGAGATLSLGGATVSIAWLWWQILYAVTDKKEMVIEGLLLDTESPMRLLVWTNAASATTWKRTLNAEMPLADSLVEVMQQVAFCVLEVLEPHLAGLINSERWKDSDAFRQLDQRDNTAEQNLELARAYFAAAYLADSERVLEDLSDRTLPQESMLDMHQLRVLLLQSKGQYAEVEEILRTVFLESSLRARWRCYAMRLTADNLAFQLRFAEATEAYSGVLTEIESATSAAGSAGGNAGGQKKWERLAQTIVSRPAGVRAEDVIPLLTDVHQALSGRARCQMLLLLEFDSEAMSRIDADLQGACEVLIVKNIVSPNVPPLTDASMCAMLARQNLNEGKRDDAAKSAERAVDFSVVAEEDAKKRLRQDEQDMGARCDLAWAYFRQAVAYLLWHLALYPVQAAQTAESIEEAGATAIPEETANTMPDEILRTRMLARVYAGLEDEERTAADEAIQAAARFNDPVKRRSGLAQTALRMADRLLRSYHDEGGLGAWQERDPENPVLIPDDLAPGVDELVKKYSRETDLTPVDVYTIYFRVEETLWMATQPETVGVLAAYAQSTVAERKWHDFRARAEAEFKELGSQAGRSSAETAYGLACLAALLEDGVEAAVNLREAARYAGEDTYAYRNRAALDEDFDSVRGHPVFQALMQRAGPPADAPDEIFKEPVSASAGEVVEA